MPSGSSQQSTDNKRLHSLQSSHVRRLDDDYILAAMETRSLHVDHDGQMTAQDIYTQLAQKERDLLLAAQLGKALLEKNEELSMQNEKIAEEYSRQLEVLSFFSFMFGH